MATKGFSQQEGLDFNEIFTPIAILTTSHVSFALDTIGKWSLFQMDVNNTFLHDNMDKEVYTIHPPRLYRQGESSEICQLHKFLYGLKKDT